VAGGRVRGVTLDTGEQATADLVVSDASGIGTYLDLVPVPERARARLRALPLQSPGACAYLAVRGSGAPPYLRFRLPGDGRLCQLLVTPSVPCPELVQDGWAPARLIAPMRHQDAERGGADGQRAFLEELLADGWWRGHVGAHRVLETRVPAEWGRAFHLHRDSMNPVMTARFMRAGRLAHRSPHVGGLYLAGSATHPGQWVSFCAISGVLAAERAIGDA
jgi:phytoene dehydrogenase-like protein